MQTRVSVAELIDNDVPLRPEEAVSIVCDVCRQHASGEIRGIPNPTVIRLTSDGAIVIEGPVSQDHSAVPAAAALLNDLLAGFHTANGFKISGGLRLILARASGTLDVPPFSGPAELGAALERFAAPDLADVVRTLFRSWAARQEARTDAGTPPALTISDIRRARRATGLTLEDVSRSSGLPAEQLRELEWGYVRQWTADAAGRDALARYARAAGLDEDLVVSVAWPLIESEAGSAAADVEEPPQAAGWALVPAAPQALIPARQPSRVPAPSFLRHRWAIALAAAVLLVAVALWTEWDVPRPAPPAQRPVVRLDVQRDVPPPPSTAAFAEARPASYVQPASPDRPVNARARKPAPQKSRSAHRSFFQREILRIVIR